MNNKKYVNTEELYFCYSLKMFHFLKANNFWYKYKELMADTNRYVFVFVKTPELMEAVTYYITQNKKNKDN